jgi:hypothetical protein
VMFRHMPACYDRATEVQSAAHRRAPVDVNRRRGGRQIRMNSALRTPVPRDPRILSGGPADSEVTGPAFNPGGDRLYFSSQPGTVGNLLGPGITFEVTGPFRSRHSLGD